MLSAALFGVSPVFCKLLIGDMSPLLLAGLLYLGSGVGLQALLLVQRKSSRAELRLLSPGHRLKLVGAVISGGIVAPVCLAFGIKYGTASEVSLLLNLETVATTLIAWLVFREYIGPYVWSGKVLILVGAGLVVLKTQGGLSFSLSGLLVVIACIFWGIDNNLTRDVDEISSTVLASVKGLAAGLFSIVLALVFTTGVATPGQIAGALSVGALSYGLSLVLFVEALRQIGAARTATFFAVGPFFGTLLAVALLGERPPAAYWYATVLMLAGILLLYVEVHGHRHTHEELAHGHPHRHDEHHDHDHPEGERAEPHDHFHVHRPVTHSHVHWPDQHHRHEH
ncbi:DMT family transporter [Geomonas subterranea]|uniref:DMT family transporter n=2 Tax=Geomonas subterranea TaxID=2847989 RepID=A0ABX8LKZ0_9BACT|nr:DMT family transporter [Geomonas subterranea]QXE90984.1 DMT family transporter [Geomonas subterranea]QXM10930.1 DMT family transporter [Geomonas subterranea]